jgi:hypothetical protein
MKQGRGDDNIPVSLTSSNSGWHKGWFYLWNDPGFALPAYTGNSIDESRRNWSDGPAKAEQEEILKDHCVVLRHLREPGSPCRKSSGSTMPEELCRSGGDRFISAR